MSDFEDRLGRALSKGAEDAPGAAGLASGARVRARRRRNRRVAFGAAAAVVMIAVPVAVVSSGSDPEGQVTDPPPAEAVVGQRVTCSGGDGWDVATMDGGLSGVVDDAEVRAAFADVLAEAPLDAPTAIREQGAEAAPYIVLADAGDSYTLGIGPWSIAGPGRTAMSAGLERQPDGTLRMSGWGDCQLTSVLPAGRSLVEVSAPDGGVDPTTKTPTVLVSEAQCASARDPEPYLGEPTIVADDERVLITMTSDPVVGGADCPGNPFVPLTFSLDEPIGDRELYDAGTYPATPIELASLTGASSDSWQTVTYEGDPVNESGDRTVLVDVPPGWERLDTSSCGGDVPRFGVPGNNACEFTSTVSLYGSSTYDAADPPGLIRADAASGYVYVGELVANVQAPDHETARRILASVRLPGETAPSQTWTTEDLSAGVVVEVPDDGSVEVGIQLYRGGNDLDVSANRRGPGPWQALVNVRKGTRVLVTAPTQSLADVVASTVRPVD